MVRTFTYDGPKIVYWVPLADEVQDINVLQLVTLDSVLHSAYHFGLPTATAVKN